MTPSLDPSALAQMVTEVTEAMFGASFALVDDALVDDALVDDALVDDALVSTARGAAEWRTVGIDMTGDKRLVVALSTDKDSAIELGAAMFSCPPAQVDGAMVDDALGEIVNILAGQMKVTLGSAYVLGLPQVLARAPHAEASLCQAATLQTSQYRIRMCVVVSEALSAA